MRRKIQKYLSGEREGFSLIELIIVIAIMAILIGVVALVVLPYLESSRESTDRAALNEVATAFKSAASVNSKYAKIVNGMATAKDSDSLDSDLKNMVGDDDGEVPPVPIPNTAVKLTRAQDSSLETARENR